MKNPLVLLTLVVSTCAVAQPYQHEMLTYYDDDAKPTKEKKAVMLKQQIQLSDTLWETNIYWQNGPRSISIQSATADDMARDGTCITYRQDGWADTLGYYKKGKRNGNWLVFDGKYLIWQLHFDEDRLIWKKDTLELKRERDSIKTTNANDTLTKVEIESEYPGGARAWLRFLDNTLRYPEKAVKKNLMGQVTIGFVVDAHGIVPPASLWLKQSASYPLDKEGLRVIYLSGNWIPAMQFGKKVKSYKLQPLIFRMETFNKF